MPDRPKIFIETNHMTRETIGLTAYRLIFDDDTVLELQGVALIQILSSCLSYKPRYVYVLDGLCKRIDQETIDHVWNKIQDSAPSLHY
jgi:hypothetical protein